MLLKHPSSIFILPEIYITNIIKLSLPPPSVVAVASSLWLVFLDPGSLALVLNRVREVEKGSRTRSGGMSDSSVEHINENVLNVNTRLTV